MNAGTKPPCSQNSQKDSPHCQNNDAVALKTDEETVHAVAPPPEPFLSRREFELRFTRPIVSFDSLTSMGYTVTQGVGLMNDYFGSHLRLDRSPWTRTALALEEGYLVWVASYYLHEFGHTQQMLNHGFRLYQMGGIDLGDWTPLAPKWRKSYCQECTNVYEDQLRYLNGLHAQQGLATYVQQKNVKAGDFTPDEAWVYLINQLASASYAGFNLAGGEGKDLALFRETITENGEGVNRGEFFLWSGMSALASYHTWESAGAILNYVATGNRRPQKMASLAVTEDVKIFPPHIEFFPHPFGVFSNAHLAVQSPSWPQSVLIFQTGFGRGPGFNLWRAGAELSGIPVVSPFSFDLFGAYDIQTVNAEELLNDGYNGERIAGARGLQELVRQTNGYLAGGRLHTDFGPVRLTLQASHAKDDFIETALKGRRPVLLDDTGRKEPFSHSRWKFSLTAAYVYPGTP